MRTPTPYMADSFAIYIGFDQIKDEKERQDFLNLPTTFALPREEADRLRRIGPKILDESEIYQKLCAELRCQEK
jgi:hypothetical protein